MTTTTIIITTTTTTTTTIIIIITTTINIIIITITEGQRGIRIFRASDSAVFPRAACRPCCSCLAALQRIRADEDKAAVRTLHYTCRMREAGSRMERL